MHAFQKLIYSSCMALLPQIETQPYNSIGLSTLVLHLIEYIIIPNRNKSHMYDGDSAFHNQMKRCI